MTTGRDRTRVGRGPRRRRDPARIAGRVLLVTVTLAGTVVLGGCGSTEERAAGSGRIAVTMHDFGFGVSPSRVRAGRVTFEVANDGPSTHEINVDRTRYRSGAIPLQRDGLTADEEAPGLHRMGSIEQVNLRGTDDLTLELTPGRYVLWCNLEGHYLGGMHQVIEVLPRSQR